jgi:UDP-N-acetyl-D-mannosaminuronic acid dehydrogenase
VILIAVETPVDEQTKAPAYEMLHSALGDLAQNLCPGTLVIIESTLAPRTMERVVRPQLEQISGLKVNEDFYLAHCPERVMPGKLLANIAGCHRVIGGMSPETAEVAAELYRTIVKADLDLTDCLTAEVVKTAENTYRDVQIAFANEVALLCEAIGADVWEVRELVNKSPFRAMHLPGAGVGGHCIPKDPWLLLHSADKDFKARLIPAARAINDGMPYHMVELVRDALCRAGKEVKGAKIAVLGYTYLENSDDSRNSPSIPLIEGLQELGAEVVVHDPYVPEYAGPLEQVVKVADCVVVMVAHDEYRKLRLEQLEEWLASPVVVDGRNVFTGQNSPGSRLVYRVVGNSRPT